LSDDNQSGHWNAGTVLTVDKDLDALAREGDWRFVEREARALYLKVRRAICEHLAIRVPQNANLLQHCIVIQALGAVANDFGDGIQQATAPREPTVTVRWPSEELTPPITED